MKVIICIAMFALAGWFIYDMGKRYVAAQGTTWDRILSAGKGSATIAWSKLTAALAALSGGAAYLGDWLGDPTLTGAVQAILKPELIPFFMLGVALVTIWARKRTL